MRWSSKHALADTLANLEGRTVAFLAHEFQRAGIVPRERYKLTKLRTINLAGSPASSENMAWFYQNVKEDLWVANGNGGTDCCTGFVGGVPTLPVRAGEIQAPSLGVSVKAFNAQGESVIDEVGDLMVDRGHEYGTNTGRKRRPGLAGCKHEGMVERNDADHDAEWLAEVIGDRLLVEFGDRALFAADDAGEAVEQPQQDVAGEHDGYGR